MAVSERSSIRILLADDHGLLRRALARLIESFQGMQVVAEAATDRDLISAADLCPADVALVDAALPEFGAIDATRRLRERFPGMAVIVLSIHASDDYGQRALAGGARGYIGKDASVADFEQAIRQVSGGARYFAATRHGTPETSGAGVPPVLTPRQRQVLALVVAGYRTRDIAERLSLSVKTIESHRAQIMRRLGVRHMPGLIRIALKLGLVRFDEG